MGWDVIGTKELDIRSEVGNFNLLEGCFCSGVEGNVNARCHKSVLVVSFAVYSRLEVLCTVFCDFINVVHKWREVMYGVKVTYSRWVTFQDLASNHWFNVGIEEIFP